jgi:hypothetical protein
MWGLQRHRRLTTNAVVAKPEADISEPGTMPAPHIAAATATTTIGDVVKVLEYWEDITR